MPQGVYCRCSGSDIMKNYGSFKTCRLCGEKTWDFDAETGEWWCDTCDDWAEL